MIDCARLLYWLGIALVLTTGLFYWVVPSENTIEYLRLLNESNFIGLGGLMMMMYSDIMKKRGKKIDVMGEEDDLGKTD